MAPVCPKHQDFTTAVASVDPDLIPDQADLIPDRGDLIPGGLAEGVIATVVVGGSDRNGHRYLEAV
jgi:hypothetical protein